MPIHTSNGEPLIVKEFLQYFFIRSLSSLIAVVRLSSKLFILAWTFLIESLIFPWFSSLFWKFVTGALFELTEILIVVEVALLLVMG